MPSARIRFLFEAGFLIAVAAAAGALQLEPVAIVAVMVVAWLATALVERAAAQRPAQRSVPAADGPAEKRRPGRGSRRARSIVRGTPIEASLAPTAPHVEVLEPKPPPPEPTPEEPLPTEPVPPQPEPTEPEPVPSLEPAASRPRPPLVALPTPEREEIAVREPPVREPEPSPAARRVVTLSPHRGHPRAWNLWELERVVRERAGENAARDEERNYLLVYLRPFARPDGQLAVEFDDVVRESFGDLLASPSR